jgi:hypothetical protein
LYPRLSSVLDPLAVGVEGHRVVRCVEGPDPAVVKKGEVDIEPISPGKIEDGDCIIIGGSARVGVGMGVATSTNPDRKRHAMYRWRE